MAKVNRPDLAQIEEFDRHMREWQAVLGLKGWRVERIPGWSSAMAEVQFDDGARLAAYKVGNFGAAAIDDSSLNTTALHEMLHILLRNLIVAAQSRDDARIEAEEHTVINTLEKLLSALPGGV